METGEEGQNRDWYTIAIKVVFSLSVSGGFYIMYRLALDNGEGYGPPITIGTEISLGANVYAPIILITIYSFVCCIISLICRQNYIKFADSVYYLGFMLTLMALVFSLSQYESQEGNEDIIRSIISQNGYALASTVWGLFIRVLLVPFEDVREGDDALAPLRATPPESDRTSLPNDKHLSQTDKKRVALRHRVNGWVYRFMRELF